MGACRQSETCGLCPPNLAMPEVVSLLGRTYTHLSEVGPGFVTITYFESSLPNEVTLELYLKFSPSISRG